MKTASRNAPLSILNPYPNDPYLRRLYEKGEIGAPLDSAPSPLNRKMHPEAPYWKWAEDHEEDMF